MGLSIHYSGAFKQSASLSSLIEEVKDIAEAYNWEYHVFNDTFIESEFGKKEHTEYHYTFDVCLLGPDCMHTEFTDHAFESVNRTRCLVLFFWALCPSKIRN